MPADQGGTLLSNTLAFSKLTLKDRFSKWNKPVDRSEWEMSADTVNAYYHPFRNVIVFPAAILQAPFYSLEQSSSANYGESELLSLMRFPMHLIITALCLMNMAT